MRFLLLLFITPFNSYGQSNDTTKISGKIGTEYFDIFRQRSDRLSTTFFTRSFDATISASHGCDTLAIGYSEWDRYASYNNYSSDINSAAENRLRSFSLQWTSSIGWFDYSGSILVPIAHTFFPFRSFSGWVQLKPIGRVLTSSISFNNMPTSFTSGLGLKDFLVPLNDESNSSEWNITLQSRPYDFIEGTFKWGKSNTTLEKISEGYSPEVDWRTENLFAQIKIFTKSESSIWIGYEKTIEKGNAAIYQKGLLFGYLTDGNLIYNKWLAGGRTILFSLPISCEYGYNRWEGGGIGDIESWPFTSLAAAVFSTNRLYYEVKGKIIVHQIEGSTSLKAGRIRIEPVLDLYHILTNMSLNHWELQSLIFYMNFKEEPFSIEQCWLLRLGCRMDFPLFGANGTLHLEQFIPLSVKYREEQKIPGVPSAPTVTHGPSSTDGGRRIRLELSLL